MEAIATRKDGSRWYPTFVEVLDKAKCIACGRCYKSCPSGVMELDSYEDDEENEINFMKLVNDANCIGCKVCAGVCPRGCFEHSAAAAS
jgi:Nif-specific ferredoxin III